MMNSNKEKVKHRLNVKWYKVKGKFIHSSEYITFKLSYNSPFSVTALIKKIGRIIALLFFCTPSDRIDLYVHWSSFSEVCEDSHTVRTSLYAKWKYSV